MQPERYTPQTHDGWRLELRRYLDPATHRPQRAPLLFVPGYGMNSHILAYHPSGESMVEHLVRQGYEVWTANLRGQGGARRVGGRSPVGFEQLALIDVPAARDEVLRRRRSAPEQLVFLGCSLGASVLYAYLAHHPQDHGACGVVALGGPLRWVKTHALMRAAFASEALVSKIHLRGTRQLARVALPLVRRAPGLLSMYMNAAQIDLSEPDKIAPTVDDPVASLNAQIARWMRQRDLIVSGLNITRALDKVRRLPLLCVLANRDGVVPPEVALSILDAYDPAQIEVLMAGDEEAWFAHADLFIAQRARDWVFRPMAAWLERLPHA